jgi:hypothetical protein
MAADPGNRIVTPDTDPARFTAEETRLYKAGKCPWQTATGTGGGDEFCGRRSKRGASFGYCDEHGAELLVESFPDGSYRADADRVTRSGRTTAGA